MPGEEFETSVLDAAADVLAVPEDHDDHDHDHEHDHEHESAQEAGQSAGSRSDFEHEEDDHEDDHDDVFSEHSPRSSLSGSLGTGGSGEDKSGDEGACHERLPRLSDISMMSGFARVGGGPRLSDLTEAISHMSQYEIDLDEERHRDDEGAGEGAGEGSSGLGARRGRMPSTSLHGTPRAAFRTPSAVRAMQMSSPTTTSPPLIYGGSPRSVRQRRRQLQEEEERGRRDSSASASASARQTPTRFRVIRSDPAPLVLLHATLMPARWSWGPVLDRWILEEDAAEHDRDDCEQSDMPNTLRQLHAAWCQLQSIMGGDTVTERGVLLPHPQDDYEVLEERLLEALELPMRRRARILECGHYLGPEDDDGSCSSTNSEDDYDRNGELDEDSRHWCPTCRAEIRYEPLSAERVYRVKVYASNGLMTVGAWSACWREMERVDVEIEPILLDAGVVRELARLRAAQEDKDREREREERERQMRDIVVAVAPSPSPSDLPADDHFRLSPSLSPSPAAVAVRPPTAPGGDSSSEAWRYREAEDRLREIYGRTPPAAETEGLPGAQSPPSPSAAAYERREERRRQTSQSYAVPTAVPTAADSLQTASMGELLLAAGKVFLRDHRHVAIIVLSALVILLVALRPGEPTVVMMPAMQAMQAVQAVQARGGPAGTPVVGTRAAVLGTEIPRIAIPGVSSELTAAAVAGDECAPAEGDSAYAVVDALAAMMEVDMDVDGYDMDECFFGEESLPALQENLPIGSGTVLHMETVTATATKTMRVYETVTETATKTTRVDAAGAAAVAAMATSGSGMVAAAAAAAAAAAGKQQACVQARMAAPELDMVAHDPDAPAQLAAAERVHCGRA